MPIKTKTTNMTGAFAKLALLLKIRHVLQVNKHLNADTFIGHSIMHAIDTKRPAEEILNTIKDYERDNPVMITRLLGDELMQEVLDINL